MSLTDNVLLAIASEFALARIGWLGKASKSSMTTKVLDESTSFAKNVEFSGVISGSNGTLNVEIEMIRKMSNSTSGNANIISAIESMAKKYNMSQIRVTGNVINEAAAAKASQEYVKAGYRVSTKTTNLGMTELTRVKTLK
ncbi:hypothetical protein [Tenacibaculum maritimum]|uniref:hypothetical protein n=1 Tax=Tenacibaculum maritimum TaxID=107401 RepID=UPI00133044AE|nr:hypothetical protein [Tenacibaculum maritimum]